MRTVTSGACIRLYADGPALHVNDTHAAVGVTGVQITDTGDLEVLHVAGRVVSINPQPDETLTARGITAGGSGGSGRSVVRLCVGTATGKPRRLNLTIPTEYALVAGDTSNLWFTVTHALPCPLP